MLRDLLNWLLPGESSSERVPDAFWESVKLLHADDLRRWKRFEQYENHDSTSYREYWEGAKRIAELRREVRRILATIVRVEALDHEGLESYDTVAVPIRRSLLRRPITVELPRPPYAGTVFDSQDGEVGVGRITVKAGWRRREVWVSMSCPSRILHAEEITAGRRWLEERSGEEMEKLREVQTSRFAHPVLFISHRWESADHPDPNGAQLAKLSALRDCFVIYDFSSFPQNPESEEGKAALELILQNMGRLIQNVVVLASPSYTERGWCLYEYLMCSFQASTVCDEVQDADFVALRNWCAMHPPPPAQGAPFHGHSIESSVQNSMDENILKAVNRILPRYQSSLFTVAADREVVTELLIDQLQAALPAKKEYLTYLGEWKDTPWTREELERAFTDELHWESLHTARGIPPDELDVPATLEEAIERRYTLPRPPPQNALSATMRVFRGLFGRS